MSHPITAFPVLRLRPLGHLSRGIIAEALNSLSQNILSESGAYFMGRLQGTAAFFT